MRRSDRQTGHGFTLVETALLLSIFGVLLAVAAPTFVRTLETSKTVEATETLAAIHRGAAAYYAARHGGGRVVLRSCLPPAAGPTPATAVASPAPLDLSAETSAAAPTWRALGLAGVAPRRYRYTFAPALPGCVPGAPRGTLAYRALAEGDLDADGWLSRFERRARVVDADELAADPMLYVTDRIE